MLFVLYGMYFYTDVFGISPAAVGTIFLLARIWDAINDPIMGIIADRTKTKWGRFRPYLLWMAVPYGIIGFTCFIVPDWSDSAKVAYAAITYVTFGMVYTAINLPYSGLMAVISADPIERTDVSQFRFIGANLGGLTVAVCVPVFINYFGKGNEQTGYLVTVGIFSGLAILLFLTTFLTTKERVESPHNKNSLVMSDIKDLGTNMPALALFFASLFNLGSISIHMANVPYYFKYYIQDTNSIFGWSLSSDQMVGVFFTVGMVFVLLGIFTTSFFVRKLGKINAFSLLMGLASSIYFLQYYVTPSSVSSVFVYEAIAAFLAGPTIPIIFSMYADAADYSEWKTGRRATGLVMAFSSFGMKFGWAIGGALGGWALAWFGYIANEQQTVETLDGIRLMFAWVPAILGLISAAVLFMNPLKTALMNTVVSDLQQRRESINE